MAESVISTIKTELTKRTTWRTRLQLELALVVYIGWYNAHRLHRALNGRTPLEVLDEYNQQQTAARATVAST
jgi:transposase InsO family protein